MTYAVQTEICRHRPEEREKTEEEREEKKEEKEEETKSRKSVKVEFEALQNMPL